MQIFRQHDMQLYSWIFFPQSNSKFQRGKMSRLDGLRAVVCLPDAGFDPTEVAVPFKYLTEAGCQVDFATEQGRMGECDPRLVQGYTQKWFGATSPMIKLYNQMRESYAFQHPKAWEKRSFKLTGYDIVILPGGHVEQMKQYIESPSLHTHLAEYFPLTLRQNTAKKTIGAICHGVLTLARSEDNAGRSVLYDAETTTLPRHMEKFAFFMTWPILGRYFRTYSDYCVDDVIHRLKSPDQYHTGPWLGEYAFVDPDFRYVSARFPGDAKLFAQKLIEVAADRES